MVDTAQHERSTLRHTASFLRYERYEGGSLEAERLVLDKLAHELVGVERASRHGGPAHLLRTFRAKPTLGVDNARLRFHDDLPEALRVGYAQPGAEYPAVVRLSHASGTERPDAAPDLRGMAVRVQAGPEGTHDLLATSFPVSHAADAREYVAFAKAMAGAGSAAEQAFGLLVKLPLAVGWSTAARMRRNVHTAARHTVGSLARETFWSCGAILWGDAGPVRYQLRPAPGGTPAPPPDRGDPDYLHRELTQRLFTGDICFELCVQRYLDEHRTPVEDGSVEWQESDTPLVPVALLTVPRQDLDAAAAHSAVCRVEQLAFNPWHTTDEFRPLGNLNRARKAAYEASGAQLLGLRLTPAETLTSVAPLIPVAPLTSVAPRRDAVLPAPVRAALGLVTRYVPWHRLPLPAGLRGLVAPCPSLPRAGDLLKPPTGALGQVLGRSPSPGPSAYRRSG
ncbi:hypothetical protein [Streptomyces sp. ME19-01-6]|uniref:hypothetical protein n=1 Tax=Streptomyces sp. ME19-01-6 TaxID=3028686 RepID=UPI0029C9BEE9|nr:hypothetical protein [Streptomyces sp. ME19-01-6]